MVDRNDMQILALRRLRSQQIADPGLTKPEEAVFALGALQAQDYAAALWAIGLRLSGSTLAEVEGAIAGRKIVRGWLMRGTLQFVSAKDYSWMLKLLAPGSVAGMASRQRSLGLDLPLLERSHKIFYDALQGGNVITRDQMMQLLRQGGIPTEGQRGYHILWRMAQEGLICFGPRQDKQQTFVLLEEWLPKGSPKNTEDSLAELARRYFEGHGPATLEDFAWWSGLKKTDARAGLDAVERSLQKNVAGNTIYWSSANRHPEPSNKAFLLPAFDEYLLSYRDRTAVLDPEFSNNVSPGSNGVFQPLIVIHGRIAGTWKHIQKKSKKINQVLISLFPFTSFTKTELGWIQEAADQYGSFLGLPVKIL